VLADGRVIARSGSSPHGQGHETTFAQIVADRLGIDHGEVELRFGEIPGVGTYASRSVAMGGSALVQASEEILAQATRVAAERLHCPADEVGRTGRDWTAPDGRTVSWAEAAAGLKAEVRFESDLVFGSGAYAAVVEIDVDTGALHVRRLAAVDDAGKIVNPLLAEGQVLGGVAQGLGAVLSEEAVHDGDGQLRNASFVDYGMPGAVEMPDIATAFVQTPSPHNPLGAKGIGEGGAIGTPAAIANAVADALGADPPDPPFTPEKLWRALRGRRELGVARPHGRRAKRGPVEAAQPSGRIAPRSAAGRPLAGAASWAPWSSTVLRSEVTSRSSGSEPPTV
jgi:aerobic carbon-monoxide dehydrogenase large subunit